MLSRPTIHLTNWSSRTQHGPGRKLCAMARPRHWEHGEGTAYACAPAAEDLDAVRSGVITMEQYRFRCERRFAGALEHHVIDHACPVDPHSGPGFLLADGDTLLCACARPDSPRRTHECHLEWLAPFLVKAGWRVVLYGAEFSP